MKMSGSDFMLVLLSLKVLSTTAADGNLIFYYSFCIFE